MATFNAIIPFSLAFFGGGGGGGNSFGFRGRNRQGSSERGGFHNARQQGRTQRGNTPMDNRRQHAQTDAVARQLRLNDSQRRELHDLVSGQGWGFQRALQEARSHFGLD